MTHNYIVVKHPKSVGISIILTTLIGPLGLFYATVSGGVIMSFFPLLPLALILKGALGSDSTLMIIGGSLFVLYGVFWWIICIIWGVIAVNNYNKKILDEAASLNNFLHSNEEYNANSVNLSPTHDSIGNKKPNLQSWLKENPYKGINDYYKEFGV